MSKPVDIEALRRRLNVLVEHSTAAREVGWKGPTLQQLKVLAYAAAQEALNASAESAGRPHHPTLEMFSRALGVR